MNPKVEAHSCPRGCRSAGPRVRQHPAETLLPQELSVSISHDTQDGWSQTLTTTARWEAPGIAPLVVSRENDRILRELAQDNIGGTEAGLTLEWLEEQ